MTIDFRAASEAVERCTTHLKNVQICKDWKSVSLILEEVRPLLDEAMGTIQRHADVLNFVSDGILRFDSRVYPSAHEAVLCLGYNLVFELETVLQILDDLTGPGQGGVVYAMPEKTLTKAETSFPEKLNQFKQLDLSALSALIRRERVQVLPFTEPFSESDPIEGITPGKLATELDICTKTVNRYAKRLGIITPKPGEREFRYRPDDAKKIRDLKRTNNGH